MGRGGQRVEIRAIKSKDGDVKLQAYKRTFAFPSKSKNGQPSTEFIIFDTNFHRPTQSIEMLMKELIKQGMITDECCKEIVWAWFDYKVCSDARLAAFALEYWATDKNRTAAKRVEA